MSKIIELNENSFIINNTEEGVASGLHTLIAIRKSLANSAKVTISLNGELVADDTMKYTKLIEAYVTWSDSNFEDDTKLSLEKCDDGSFVDNVPLTFHDSPNTFKLLLLEDASKFEVGDEIEGEDSLATGTIVAIGGNKFLYLYPNSGTFNEEENVVCGVKQDIVRKDYGIGNAISPKISIPASLQNVSINLKVEIY